MLYCNGACLGIHNTKWFGDHECGVRGGPVLVHMIVMHLLCWFPDLGCTILFISGLMRWQERMMTMMSSCALGGGYVQGKQIVLHSLSQKKGHGHATYLSTCLI